MILLILILSLFTRLDAPPSNTIFIFGSEGINYYDSLIKALTYVESRNGKYTWNPQEEAVGWFQITPIRVDHYNRSIGTDYKLEDFYDYSLSREMFLYYASGKSYEVAARNWNGKWSLTESYWQKVKEQLNN